MRLKDIKEISSDSVRLVTEFGSPGMIESLRKIKEIASIVQEITDSIEDPQMVNNLERINLERMRTASEALQHAGDRIRNVSTRVNETGIVDETKSLALSVKNKRDSKSEQNLKEIIIAFKDAVKSIKSLANELRRL